eukprot:SAG31_NODE_31839_length_363_cov_0.981061_1_plen_33_part_01
MRLRAPNSRCVQAAECMVQYDSIPSVNFLPYDL